MDEKVVGVKLNEVKLGGVVSVAEVTVKTVGKPAAAAPAVSRNRVLFASSATMMLVRFQVPGSLSLGNVMTKESVLKRAGAKVALVPRKARRRYLGSDRLSAHASYMAPVWKGSGERRFRTRSVVPRDA